MCTMVDKLVDDSDAFKGKISNVEHVAVMAFAAMDMLRKSEKLCDIRIKVDTTEFLAHKVVLAAHSPYFEAMFTGQFEESQKPVISMTNIKANIMSIILDFLYTGNIELTESSAQHVLYASNFLQIVPLFESCCNILLENMNTGNCLGLYTLGKLLSSGKLKDKSKDYAMIHFSTVCQETEFLELDAEILIDMIESDSLIVHSEESVFFAVMKWLHFKEEERIQHLPQILKHVRLALLSPDFLKNQIETKECILKSPLCMQQVKQVEKFLLMEDADQQSFLTKQRNTSPNLEAMLVFGEYTPGVDGSRGKETKLLCISIDGLVLKNLKKPRNFECIYVSQNQSVLLASHRDTIWRYDCGRNEWNAIAPLKKRRFSYGLCEIDGFWFAIGGFLPGSSYHTCVCNTVERYQPSNVWVELAPMPTGVLGPAVVGLQGMVYVLGGENKQGVQVNLVQRYDTRTNTWSNMAPFQSDGLNLKACALFQRIYLFSVGERSPIQVYNASLNTWEEYLQSERTFVSGPVIFDGKIYVLTISDFGVRTIESFTPANRHWDKVAVFPNFLPYSIFLPLRSNIPRKVNLKEERLMTPYNATSV